jgi:hypothetical protein
MHLATAYVYNQSNIGRVQWLDSEGESLLIDGKRLSRADIRIVIENGIKALKEQLYNKVLLGSNIAIVTEDDLFDDLRDRNTGASFVSQSHISKAYSLLGYIAEDHDLSRRFVESDNSKTITFSRRSVK